MKNVLVVGNSRLAKEIKKIIKIKILIFIIPEKNIKILTIKYKKTKFKKNKRIYK